MIKKNEIKIEPITAWVNGQIKQLNLISFNYYSQYDFDRNPGYVNYSLCDLIEDDEVQRTIPYINENMYLPLSLIETWGEDDTPIFDYVLQQLQLTRA